MAQKCVFCGGTPQNKNKEHVIPQWLSKYLDSYKKICDLTHVTDRQIPYCGLTFPACEKCNTRDAQLEAEAKSIIEKMMAGTSVTGLEINTLLDWFDKLRTGLWLGELMLSKTQEEVDPNYYINDRMGQKDRMLIIERIDGIGNGLGLVGANTTVFKYAPCVFQILFNDIVITSASTTGLVSNKLGFPYLGKAQDANYRQQCAKLFAGRNKTTHPVVMNIDATNKTIVYQPIFKEIFDSKKHDVPYVHRHSYDYDARLGGIFVQRNNNQIRYLDKEDKVNLIPKAQTKDKLNLSIRRVFELQNYTVVDMFKIDTLSADYRRYLNACVRNNEKLIESYTR